MKSFTRMVLAVLIVVLGFLSLNLTINSSSAEAKTANVTLESQSDWLIFVRVVEPAGSFIYVYTEGGVFITKYEEL